jgi:hypothetical protein
MKLTLTILLIVGLLSLGSCSSHPRLISLNELAINAPMPCRCKNIDQLVIASAQTASYCDVQVNGILFTVASTDNKHISYISTSDPSFRTPEGVGVGSALQELQKKYGPMSEETGWAYFFVLPSGWCASFSISPLTGIREPSGNAKVSWLFKRS